MDGQPGRKRPTPIHIFSYHYLLLPPILFAALTGIVLFVHSDVNIALLYSQCHSRSRVPWLSHIPLLGSPACFLVSFFQEALASARSFAAMADILAFIGGLLTVNLVESARIANGPSVLIAYPTGAWLVFNLIGGALVWELVIIPAFFHRSKQILEAREAGREPDAEVTDTDPTFGAARRHLGVLAEVVAIPVAVSIGFVLPSLLMLILDSSVVIFVWLFFPIYVSVIRQVVRFAIVKLGTSSLGASLHLESHRPSLLAMYAVPVVCSVLAHWLLIWSVFQGDDRKEMTRATGKFIEIDVFFIMITVLYWVFVEAGWKVAIVMMVVSILFGPGAGICVGWVYREGAFAPDSQTPASGLGAAAEEEAGESEAAAGGGAEPGEHTPLLR